MGKKKYVKTIILAISAAIMIGHGARMMFQGLFHPNSYYPAPTPLRIDFWFDWATLLVLGSIVFYFVITSFYKKLREDKIKKESNEENKILFNPS